LSLPTSLMEEVSIGSQICTDVVDETVPRPGGPSYVSWGVAETETSRIGFIRCDYWGNQAGTAWEQACAAMVTDTTLDGLIVDFRANMGGNMFLSSAGLAHLFNDTLLTVDFAERSDPNDHFALSRSGDSVPYRIAGNPDSFFDKPIAVLLGPRTISSGDQVALRMTYHPMVQTFGLPTSGAFDSPVAYSVSGYSQFSGKYSVHNSGRVELPDEYLSSIGVPVDHEVWLEPGDCRNGVDTVVELARDWILTGLTSVHGFQSGPAQRIVRASPNPFNPQVLISFNLEQPAMVTLSVYDLAGRKINDLSHGVFQAGTNEVTWNGRDRQGRNVASGTYLVRMKTQQGVEQRKVMLVR
jgi:hypothetical protein